MHKYSQIQTGEIALMYWILPWKAICMAMHADNFAVVKPLKTLFYVILSYFKLPTWSYAKIIEIRLQQLFFTTRVLTSIWNVFCLVCSVAGQKLHRLVWASHRVFQYCTYFRAQGSIQMCGVFGHMGAIQIPPKSETPMPASKAGYPL